MATDYAIDQKASLSASGRTGMNATYTPERSRRVTRRGLFPNKLPFGKPLSGVIE
ncbi:MAG TPA: hypothetical protein ENO27_00135 [Caldithrix sp.]|nr:hypothetical protein [Caldithrix sp.]